MKLKSEVAVLGGDAGRGESIILTVNDSFIIIDSFIDKKSGEPAPIAYLKSLGANLSDVKFVLASHWHDDHIKGLDNVLSECPNAELIISDALTSDEFKTLIYHEMTKPVNDKTMSTFHNLLRNIQKTKKYPHFAGAEKRIWQPQGQPIELWCLSPSDKTIFDSKRQLRNLFEEYKDLSLSIPNNEGNHFSVALLLICGDEAILLGADLETTAPDLDKGWHAVTSLPSFNGIKKIDFFKVPHHGSSTGYCKGIWKKVNQESNAVITAYSSSRLPRKEMISEFKQYTNNIYLTFCGTPSPSRVIGKAADKILENNKRIKYYKGNTTYNAVSYKLNSKVVALINQARHHEKCAPVD